MAVKIAPDCSSKAVVSVSQMCRLLKISRSQFYWHVGQGTFHAPLYLASNKRPYFTAEMVAGNLRARETGIGVNGQVVIFYERRPAPVEETKKATKPNHSSWLDGLTSLGLSGVTPTQIESALAACFPSGIDGHEETAVLRTIFRHMKRSPAS